jgi:hypothetical protein
MTHLYHRWQSNIVAQALETRRVRLMFLIATKINPEDPQSNLQN